MSNKTCSNCKKPKTLEFFRKNRGICRACEASYRAERHRQLKKVCVEYLGGCCVKCKKKHHQTVFDFHHRNPNEKSFEISDKLHFGNMEKLIKELDKCDLLCANCHRLEHYTGEK